LLRIFVFEALSMIIAAIILGTTIGITVACTLTLQQVSAQTLNPKP